MKRSDEQPEMESPSMDAWALERSSEPGAGDRGSAPTIGNALAVQCLLGEARAAALLKLRSEQQVDVIASHPQRTAASSSWLGPAAEITPAALESGDARDAALRDSSGALLARVLVLPLPGQAGLAAAFLLPDLDTAELAERRARLRLSLELLRVGELEQRLGERERAVARLRWVMECLARLQQQERFAPAAAELVGAIREHCGADRVALGVPRARGVQLAAISDVDRVNRLTPLAAALTAAMNEAADQDAAVGVPVEDDDEAAAGIVARDAARLMQVSGAERVLATASGGLAVTVEWPESGSEPAGGGRQGHSTGEIGGMECHATDKAGMECRATDKTGMQCRATDKTGMQCRATDKTGMQCRATDKTGMQCRATDKTGGIQCRTTEEVRLLLKLAAPHLVGLDQRSRWVGVRAGRVLRSWATVVLGPRYPLAKLAALLVLAGLLAAAVIEKPRIAAGRLTLMQGESGFTARALIAEGDIIEVVIGQPVSARLLARPQRPLEGAVTAIARTGMASEAGAVFPVQIRIEAAPAWAREGMTGLARIETGQTTLLREWWEAAAALGDRLAR